MKKMQDKDLTKKIESLLDNWFSAKWDTGLYYDEALRLHTEQLLNLFSQELTKEKEEENE